MRITKQLLEKIEKAKLPSLPDKSDENKDDFKFSDGQKITSAPEPSFDPFSGPPSTGELDFLNQAAGLAPQTGKPTTAPVTI